LYVATPNAGANDAAYSIYATGHCRFGDSGKNIYSLAIYNDTSASSANVYIASTGRIYRSTSSRKAKTNIEDIGDTSWVYELRPVSFEAKNRLGLTCYGLIAEEVDEVAPNLVSRVYEREEVDDSYDPAPGEVLNIDGDRRFCERPTSEVEGVEYFQVVAVLLNEVQKLNKRLGELEKKAA
jgi:hypothetical protein